MASVIPALASTHTFLFTDIEGSTRLWETRAEQMRDDLARHDALLRRAIELHGGHVFKTIGDAFCAAFVDPRQAVNAAVAAQRALHKELPQIRVRMAIHTGEAEARDGDYFGPALNRVARLLNAGHGGQVLLSAAATDAVREALPEDTALQPLGTHQLRDIVETETIFQVLPPDLPKHFPPLNTVNVARRQGVIRAGSVGAALTLAFAGLAWFALDQARQARRHARGETRQRLVAENRLYLADIGGAQHAVAAGDFSRARRLLQAHVPRSGEKDRRGWEWRHLWALSADESLRTIRPGIGPVQWCFFGPDDRELLVGNDDHALLLDPRSGQEMGRLPVGAKGAAWVAYSFQCRRLVTAGAGRRVVLWDVAARRAMKSIPVDGEDVSRVALTLDGRLLAVGYRYRGRVQIREVATGRVLHQFLTTSRPSGIPCFGFSPDGRTLAYSVNSATSVKLLDVSSGSLQRTIEVGRRLMPYAGPLWTRDGRYLAVQDRIGGMFLYDLRQNSEIRLAAHRQMIGEFHFSSDGRELVTASDDGAAKIWDVRTGKQLHALRSHDDHVQDAAFSGDGRRVATAGRDGAVKLWASRPARADWLPAPPGARFWRISDGGRFALAMNRPAEVDIYERASLKRIRRITSGTELGNWGAFRNNRFIFWGREAGKRETYFLVWEAARPGAIRKLRTPALDDLVADDRAFARRRPVAPAPDARHMAVCRPDGTLELWDCERGRLGVMPAGAPPEANMDFSDDGSILAVWDRSRIDLWDVATRRKRKPLSLRPPQDSPFWVFFAPDGRRLLVGTDDGRMILWDLVADRQLLAFRTPPNNAFYLLFDPHSPRLITGDGGEMNVWSLETGELTLNLPASEAGHRFNSPVFAEDGSTLLGTSRGGVGFLHAVTPEAMRAVPPAPSSTREQEAGS